MKRVIVLISIIALSIILFGCTGNSASVEFTDYSYGPNNFKISVELKNTSKISEGTAKAVLYDGKIAIQTRNLNLDGINSLEFEELEADKKYVLEIQVYYEGVDQESNVPEIIGEKEITLLLEKTNVRMEVQIGEYIGTVELEIYMNIAPKTAENFLKLVDDEFYNGLQFHRIIYGFMVQGGRNTEQILDAIEGEFSSNGFANSLKHERGVISMARTSDKNSATSQFFIMHQDTPALDGDYASFGKVTSGIEVIDKIASVPTLAEAPMIPVVINYIKTI